MMKNAPNKGKGTLVSVLHCVSEFFAVTAPNGVGTGNKVSNRPPKEDQTGK